MTDSPEPIPLLNLKPEIEAHWDELHAAVTGVLRSGQFILGPEVEAFEQEVAQYLGAEHAIGLNSGTDALVIALRCLGVGPGDEVITTPFTFVATAEAICNVGATPVFVDIDPQTFNLDANLIESAITSRTKAILPVHLFGLPCEMESISSIAARHNLKVLEDAAQAFGARYQDRQVGSLADVAAFSFFPTKNLGGFGDGGLITTNDDEIAQTARKLRNHGGANKYQTELLGYNSRLDAMQAACLRVKLKHIDSTNQQRRHWAARYCDALGAREEIGLPSSPTHCHHVYHQFSIRVAADQRDALIRRLTESKISTAIYYKHPLHQFQTFSRGAKHPLPHTETAAQEILSLPIGPHLGEESVGRIAEVITTA